jgi:hypothetical protein
MRPFIFAMQSAVILCLLFRRGTPRGSGFVPVGQTRVSDSPATKRWGVLHMADAIHVPLEKQ